MALAVGCQSQPARPTSPAVRPVAAAAPEKSVTPEAAERHVASTTPATQAADSAEAHPPFRGFPVLPPVADADPSVREPRTFRVPTRLRVARKDDQLLVEVDQTTLQEITLQVGRNMLIGMQCEDSLDRGNGRPEQLGTSLTGSTTISGTTFVKPPGPGERLTVIFKFDLFETDIPPQHMWSPTSGKYRVLWTQELKQAIEP